jgi:uncharacterized protein YjbI with pentapeptide repeats
MSLGSEEVVDLSFADLRGLALDDADLSRAVLCCTDLSESSLVGAQFYDAHIEGAQFISSNRNGADFRTSYAGPFTGEVYGFGDSPHRSGPTQFTRARLRHANLPHKLEGSDFTQCDLTFATFDRCDLRSANFAGAEMANTVFLGTDLSGVRDLQTVKHSGPSSIGIDTLYESKGNIPDFFLRGCGVPEPLIVYAQSLVARPIEFYSCFISYSSHDQAFAERLHADLRARNLRCWFAPEDLKIGDRFQNRIEESIRLFDKVMIILSKSSVQSRWVEREVDSAREREEHQNRTVLFPVRIDDAVMSAPQHWAADVRHSRQIGDFRNWDVHIAGVHH